MKKLLGIALGLSILSFPTATSAAVEPSFPSCANPSGNLKVEYSSGTHGIAGQSAAFNGADKVYSLSDGNALQCYCGDNGQGVSTNWWKVGSIADVEQRVLEAEGWHYVADGSAWGLDSGEYMAKNSNYSCSSSNSGNGSSSSSSSSDNGSSVAGASGSVGSGGQVLGLASTGSMNMIVTILSLGLGFLSAGLLIKNASSKY